MPVRSPTNQTRHWWLVGGRMVTWFPLYAANPEDWHTDMYPEQDNGKGPVAADNSPGPVTACVGGIVNQCNPRPHIVPDPTGSNDVEF